MICCLMADLKHFIMTQALSQVNEKRNQKENWTVIKSLNRTKLEAQYAFCSIFSNNLLEMMSANMNHLVTLKHLRNDRTELTKEL